MARIRTVKPEIWTDERLTECSLSARLLFIGMLNFADDNGNQAYSPKRIKMQVFPADAIDTAPLILELIAHGVVIEYSANNEKYLHIKGFKKHQVINRPSATKIPEPLLTDGSVITHGAGTDGGEGNGMDGNGKEEPTNPIGLVVASDAGAEPEKSGKPSCPHKAIIALYHEILPASPMIRDWTAARAEVLRVRWNENSERQNIDWWRRFFVYISESPFLTGKKAGRDGRPFAPGLEWILKAENFAKIREGRYHQDAA